MRQTKWTLLRDASTDLVLSTSELKAAGVAASTIVRECRSGGRWQRMLPGVVLLHNGPPSTHQRMVSALRYAGTQGLVTGRAALNLHGLSTTILSDVLVLVPQERNRKSCGFVTIERTWRLPDPVFRSGIACAPVVRATLDGARRMTDVSSCRSVIAAVVQRGSVTVEDLASELRLGSDRGSALPRSTLRELGSDAHSVAEVAAHELYASSDLPEMVHNKKVFGPDGLLICIPDGWIDSIAFAWEIDSLQHHMTPVDHERTVLRRQQMERAGIVVVSHLPSQIVKTPDLVLDQLRSAIERARSRVRPDLEVR